MLEITALDHIQLAMPKGEEAAARRFYGGLLGLVEVDKPKPLAATGGCWFVGNGDAGGNNIAVHLGILSPFVPSTKGHPAFRVKDLEAAKRTFADADISITPDERLPNVRRFYVNDPFGNRIEILQDGDRY